MYSEYRSLRTFVCLFQTLFKSILPKSEPIYSDTVRYNTCRLVPRVIQLICRWQVLHSKVTTQFVRGGRINFGFELWVAGGYQNSTPRCTTLNVIYLLLLLLLSLLLLFVLLLFIAQVVHLVSCCQNASHDRDR